MKKAVVDLGSPRPVWSVPSDVVEAIREAFGAEWEVVRVEAPAVSDGDGAAASEEAVRAARGAEVYLGWGVPVEVARAGAGTLRWAHSASAGVGASLSPDFRATGAVLTNSAGIQAEPMADWTVAAIAFCVRGFHPAVRAQRERRWIKDAFTDDRVPVRELADTRVGIVGLGGIGRAIARRCHALGMEVRATRRRPEGQTPEGVTWVGGPDDTAVLASRSDALVITAPHTPETEGLVNDPVLRALPEGAFVINLSRGALLDEQALLRQLENGRLGGAVLDVFCDEPLPEGHPFWDHPRVLVTPHVSSVSSRYWEREAALIVGNIRRYREGRPLENVVDPARGY